MSESVWVAAWGYQSSSTFTIEVAGSREEIFDVVREKYWADIPDFKNPDDEPQFVETSEWQEHQYEVDNSPIYEYCHIFRGDI